MARERRKERGENGESGELGSGAWWVGGEEEAGFVGVFQWEAAESS
jgi:hypothetical protein